MRCIVRCPTSSFSGSRKTTICSARVEWSIAIVLVSTSFTTRGTCYRVDSASWRSRLRSCSTLREWFGGAARPRTSTKCVRSSIASADRTSAAFGRQHVAKLGPPFPRGFRLLLAFGRRVDRSLDHCHSMDVPRAVRKDCLRLHADDQLRSLELAQEDVLVVEGS